MSPPAAFAVPADPTAVDDRLRELYGEPLPPAAGITQVAAVWQAPDGTKRVLKINDATPKSDWDFFVLNAARARADAIVTTGKILRTEPALRHDLAGPPPQPIALADWRRRQGLGEPPLLVVLTSGRDLDPEHPALHGWTRAVIFTGIDVAAPVERRLGSAVEVVGVESPSLRRALDYLRDERGRRAISVEAGPSTAGELYHEPVVVDELLLSIYRGAAPAAAIGAPFLAAEQLDETFARRSPLRLVVESSGPWAFSRLLRR